MHGHATVNGCTMTTEPKQRKFYGWWLLFFLWVAYTIPVGFAFYSMPVLFNSLTQQKGR
jgi:hypothetical protein